MALVAPKSLWMRKRSRCTCPRHGFESRMVKSANGGDFRGPWLEVSSFADLWKMLGMLTSSDSFASRGSWAKMALLCPMTW